MRVDRADSTRIEIRWDYVPSDRELGRQFADLTLDVQLPGGGYSTTMRIAFSTPEQRARPLRSVSPCRCWVNPAARDQIAIDTARLG